MQLSIELKECEEKTNLLANTDVLKMRLAEYEKINQQV